jgi:hypothetical protein
MNAAQADEYLSAEDAINDMDDDEVRCRSLHHRYPLDDIRPGRKLRGVDVARQIDGCYQVVETCLDCGMVERTSVTLPGGAYDAEVVYRHRYSRRWKKVPAEFGRVRKSRFKKERDNRDGSFKSAVLSVVAAAGRDLAEEEHVQGELLGRPPRPSAIRSPRPPQLQFQPPVTA